LYSTKPEENEGRRKSRPKLRWWDEIERDVARFGCRNGEMICSQERRREVQVPDKDAIPMEEEEEEEEEEGRGGGEEEELHFPSVSCFIC